MHQHGGFFTATDAFIQAGLVLQVAQGAVSVCRRCPHPFGQQPCCFCAVQQRNIAHVVLQRWVRLGMGQHQMLHHKFGIDHAAHTVFVVKQTSRHRMGAAHFVAHLRDVHGQLRQVTRRTQHLAAHRFKGLPQGGVADTKPRPCHGLVLPDPSAVAAALRLVSRKGFHAADQQTGAAIGPQRGVDFIDIAFAGFQGQPLDQFAGEQGIDFMRLRVFVLEHKHNVQIAAVAQFFATPFAIAHDGKAGRVTVPGFDAWPDP